MSRALGIGVIHTSITDLNLLASPDVSHYTSRFPNQTVCLTDGSEAIFTGGVFSTNDPFVIQNIDAAAKCQGSMIYKGRKDLPETTVLSQAAADNETLAKVAAGGDAGKPADPATLDAAAKITASMKTV